MATLFGDTTAYTGDNDTQNANVLVFQNRTFLATAGTVTSVYLYLRGHAGGNVRVTIHASDGTIITNGISNGVSLDYEESYHWQQFTFPTNPTVTASNYYLAYITDTNNACYTGLDTSTGTGRYGSDSSGTYASPPAISDPSVIDYA